MTAVLEVANVSKSFTLHLRGGVTLPVLRGVSFAARAGECVVLAGPSGAGKSSMLKMIFGSYRCDQGSVRLYHDLRRTDLARAGAREMLGLRRRVIAYVSQFLRVIPRVAAVDVVAEPLVTTGEMHDMARRRAGDLLCRLNLPDRLWGVPPATFSGGEQQRVNIARGFVGDHALLLLDEPTASLDAANRRVVIDLVNERKRRGTAIVAIVHDTDVRDAIADRIVDMSAFAATHE